MIVGNLNMLMEQEFQRNSFNKIFTQHVMIYLIDALYILSGLKIIESCAQKIRLFDLKI